MGLDDLATTARSSIESVESNPKFVASRVHHSRATRDSMGTEMHSQH